MYTRREKERSVMRYRNPLRAASGGIFLIGLAIAFALGNTFGGHWFIGMFFITLACTSFLGSASFSRRGFYPGSYGFIWLLAIALLLITGSWLWFLVAAGVSAILTTMYRPMMRSNFGFSQPRSQSSYQPQYQPPAQQSYQPYEQGYQPPAPQAQPTYQEGGQQYPYPQTQQPQYEQPSAEYPHEMPPQQQG